MDVTSIITAIMAAIGAGGASIRGLFLPYAPALLGAIVSLVCTWTLVKHLLGEDFASTIVEFFRTLVFGMMLSVMLSAWITPIPGLNNSVAGYFSDTYKELAGVAANGSSIQSTMKVMWDNVAGTGRFSPEGCTKQMTGSMTVVGEFGSETVPAAEYVCADGRTLVDTKSSDWGFFTLIDGLMGMVLRVVAFIMGALTILTYVGTVALSEVLFSIGICLGPIMVPFMLWKPMAFLFDSWLRYMMTVGFYFIVAALILGFVSALIVAANAPVIANLNQGLSSSTSATQTALVITVVMGLALFLMLQIQSIVGMLVGGGGIDLSPRPFRAASQAMRGLKGMTPSFKGKAPDVSKQVSSGIANAAATRQASWASFKG